MYLVEHCEDVFENWCRYIRDLDEEEDLNYPFFGVEHAGHNPLNLKTKSKTVKELSYKEPIFLEYDKEKGTVRVWSSGFEYHQSGVNTDLVYAVGVYLAAYGHHIETTFEYIN